MANSLYICIYKKIAILNKLHPNMKRQFIPDKEIILENNIRTSKVVR